MTAGRSPRTSALRRRKLSGLSSTRYGDAFMLGPLRSCAARGHAKDAPRLADARPGGGQTPAVRWRTFVALQQRARHLEQPRDAVAQAAGPRVLALAAQVAAIDRLAEDRCLPQR